MWNASTGSRTAASGVKGLDGFGGTPMIGAAASNGSGASWLDSLLAGILMLALAMVSAGAAQASTPGEPEMVQLSTGSRLAVWTLPGEGPAKHTPVVYLHGGPGGFTTASVMDKGKVLRAAGFTTIYFDQAGAGRSARIPASEYTLDRAVNDLEALRISLHADRMILWGSSFGADLAVLYEQRFAERVAGLVFSSPGNFPGTRAHFDYRVTDDANIAPGKGLMAAAHKIDRDGAAAEATLTQDAAGNLFDAEINSRALDGRMVCKGAAHPDPAEAHGGNLYANRMLLKALAGLSINVLPTVAHPTMIVRGTCDFVPLANAQRYQAVYGGAVVVIEGTGHGLRENPAALDEALRQFASGPLAAID